MINRPKVICHMISSIDGMVKGDFIYRDDLACVNEAYASVMMKYSPDAILMGRVTIQEMMGNTVPDLSSFSGSKVDRSDYIANTAKSYSVVLDPKGKIAYSDADMNGSHYISVLSHQVDDEYLAYLKSIGVSYIFAGKQILDPDVILEKLHRIFKVKQVMIAGGPMINGSFAAAGLVDELSIIVAPVVTNAAEKSTIFAGESLESMDLKLISSEVLPDGILWLSYTVDNKKVLTK